MFGRVFIDQPLRPHDFLKYNAVLVIGTVRAAHVQAPGASGSDVHLINSGGKSARTPPAGDVLGGGPELEDQLARGVEGARDDDFPVSGGAGFCVAWVHVSSPCSLVL